ncbi:MAG: hypothetical protein RQ899_03730 [Pseudomonadales bacterium]|nr:hypothetical protein [Pseudomonadales bacterium]
MKYFVTGSLLLSAVFSAFLCRSVQAQPLVLQAVARVELGPLGEISGLAKSRRRDNLYWVHNDSGDQARIFAITAEGLAILPTYSRFSFHAEVPEPGKREWQGFRVLSAENIDWEDMSSDDNYLYVADLGNNGNDRRDLGIYMLSEIDPTASTQSAAIRHLPVRYPEQTNFPPAQKHFDSESLFSADGKLYVISKHRKSGLTGGWEAGANLYRLDTRFSDRDNVLVRIGSHPDIIAATGAEVSPDGQRLAVISYTALWLFDRPTQGDDWFSGMSERLDLEPDHARQLEAVAWEDEHTLLLINEQRDIFRIRLDELAGQ